ncbi:ribosome small subunit-dependent GTPase A [Saccharicrinis sp. FJH54]|uniref:ribosome small subunit-dependent GTPase A n=1 Tax=Saccharicrinis sp. FJH54 TaxID=3344665 RepID=UPI0035D50CA5
MVKTGVVTKNTGSWYQVQTETESLECRIKGKFRLKGIRSTNPVAVGDIVDVDAEHNTIVAIHERKNFLVRKSTNLSKQTHVIAANIDQAVLVATVSYPVTTTVFIDRFLSTAEAYDIPAKLIFNKTDLYNEDETDKLAEWMAVYTDIGYECLFTSVTKAKNIDKVSRLLKGKVSLLSGHSGVGKSSLINAVDPGMKLKTQEISEAHHSGKHTTTFSEMHPLKIGGYIIDTPGIRGFGTIDFERNEIYHFFPEIFKTATNCKYHNCIHVEEPGCAVKEAVENGEISYSRYISYLNILEDPDDNKYRV